MLLLVSDQQSKLRMLYQITKKHSITLLIPPLLIKKKQYLCGLFLSRMISVDAVTAEFSGTALFSDITFNIFS
jgi:hypothetical protein